MGTHIPPNERVIRDAPWQPEFTPLGARPADPPAPPAAADSPSPPPAARPPSAPTYSYSYRMARRGTRCRPSGWGWWWIVFPILFWTMLFGGWGGWWWLFLIFPGLWMFKGMFRRRSAAAALLIGLGAALLIAQWGLDLSILGAALLIGVGAYLIVTLLLRPPSGSRT